MEEEIVITFDRRLTLPANGVKERIYDLLNQAEMEFDRKTAVNDLVNSGKPAAVILSQLLSMELDGDLVKCVAEILCAE